MAESRNVPVMIVSLDPELEAPELEMLGSKVQWVTMPPDLYERITDFLAHPEKGVRRGRPQRSDSQ